MIQLNYNKIFLKLKEYIWLNYNYKILFSFIKILISNDFLIRLWQPTISQSEKIFSIHARDAGADNKSSAKITILLYLFLFCFQKSIFQKIITWQRIIITYVCQIP